MIFRFFLWCLVDSPRLTPKARRIIADPSNPVFVSAVTSWEIAIKKSLGKLKAPDDIARIVEERGFFELPIYLYHGDQVLKLPWHHRDLLTGCSLPRPWPRILMVISADRKFEKYGVKLIGVW